LGFLKRFTFCYCYSIINIYISCS